MKLFRVSSIIALLFMLQACGSAQKEENASLRAEIIALHDEVMPKMGQLKSKGKTALETADELSATESPDSLRIQSLKDLAVELDAAYEAMFVWMRQYDTEDGEQTPEKIKIYLDQQLILVKEVNVKMKAALSKADSLLQNH